MLNGIIGLRSRDGRKRSTSVFVKAMFITCLGILPIFGTSFAQAADVLGTTYHVYIDDQHVGEVDNKDVVQQVINQKVLSGLSKYENMKISLGESVSMIPEKTFNLSYDNQKVIKYLEDHLTIIAQAVEIKIGNQVIGYFNNEEEAAEIIRTYKLKYVTEEELTQVEEQKETETDDQMEQEKLSVGDTVINNIMLSKEVSMLAKEVTPDQILNIEQGVQLLEKGTLEEKVHRVSEGEVLGTIANQYDLSTKQLLALNSGLTDESILQIDQEINVTAFKSFVDVLVIEEEKVEETIKYDIKIIESEDMYKDEEEVQQEGKNGKKEVQYSVEKKNGHIIDRKSLSEEVIEEPIDKVIIKGTKVVPSRGSGSLSWPTHGGYISSYQGKRWGAFHKGIDIARPSSRTITAADHGVVESVGEDGGYGNKIVINHNNGMKTVYAHLSSFHVKSGQIVEKGAKIGVMGSTGNSTGIHLHFEVYQDGTLQNPMEYF